MSMLYTEQNAIELQIRFTVSVLQMEQNWKKYYGPLYTHTFSELGLNGVDHMISCNNIQIAYKFYSTYTNLVSVIAKQK
jgi:transcription elongation factor GreA-like protein